MANHLEQQGFVTDALNEDHGPIDGPFLGLPCTGAQWPEGRGYLRVMQGNVTGNARLVELLCGLGQVIEGGGWQETKPFDKQLALAGIEHTINAILSFCPDIISDKVVPARDTFLHEYRMDSRMPALVERALRHRQPSEGEPYHA